MVTPKWSKDKISFRIKILPQTIYEVILNHLFRGVADLGMYVENNRLGGQGCMDVGILIPSHCTGRPVIWFRDICGDLPFWGGPGVVPPPVGTMDRVELTITTSQ